MSVVATQKVVDQIISDSTFANTIQAEAMAAQSSGIGSPEWLAFMGRFADTPEELAALPQVGDPQALGWKTLLTTTTLTSLVCTSTTTTTTTTWVADPVQPVQPT